MRFRRRLWIILGVGVIVCFPGYLWVVYKQLDKAFTQQEEFVPTRIYSDVTRIAPQQSFAQIESRLKNLGYALKYEENAIGFTLRQQEYPSYLIPDNHPQVDAVVKEVSLRFGTKEEGRLLQTIRIGEQEAPDIYLEPELVATLTRSGVQTIRDALKFEDIPASVWKAIIAVEDQHFLEHRGLDPRGLARAVWVNLRTQSLAQGGSTITQQLVKNLLARRNKNIFRKINEIFLAFVLEAKYSKEQILERYLNEVYLGQVGNLEVHGVAEGAKYFFGKELEELNLAEVALMAGLIRGPGYYSPYRHKERAIERQRFVLKKMVDTEQVAEVEAKAAINLPIRLAPPQTSANKAPFFTDFVKAELIRQLKDRVTEQEIISAGFRVFTTLDVQLNVFAQQAVTNGIQELEKRAKLESGQRLEGALAAVDHTTGYIRALVGGRSYSESTFNRILNMRRQVGSTFKPFVYLAALEKGVDNNGIPYGPAYPIEDSPWRLLYDKGRQTWTPRNYENDHMGWITFRTALAHSVNTAAARMGFDLGLNLIVKTARALGVESELPLVPSLTLGVAELTPVELLRAYATIANHGVQDELTVIRGITQNDGTGYARFIYHPKQVFPVGPIDSLIDMMQTVFADGTAKSAFALGFTYPAAGKTGTTSHHRDAWFAGFTPKLTAVAWVGFDQLPEDQSKSQGKVVKVKLTGAASALPVWVAFMKKALSGFPQETFPESMYLSRVRIDKFTGRPARPDCPDGIAVSEIYPIESFRGDQSCETLWPASIKEAIENE